MEEEKKSKFSILMFPWLGHGHVFTYLDLAKKLSNKNFDIYFCSTAVNLSSVAAALENHPNPENVRLLELELPSFPDLLPQFHTTKNLPQNLWPRLFQALQMSRPSFSKIITSLSPDLLIYDAHTRWSARIASSLGIPSVHFTSVGAAAYSFFYHGFACKDSAFPFPEIYHQEHEKRAMEALHVKTGQSGQESPLAHFTMSTEIILMRTCKELEGKYIDYLSTLSNKKIVPTGTLVTRDNGGHDEASHSELMEWLNKKSKFSTVFICFGSENYFSKSQMEEMAKGLELSDVNFIWSLRFPAGEMINSVGEALPKGFLERVKERGVILQGWAPQDKILAHSSIGAFVSHCGPSSMFESLYYGVPIIGIPLKFDQPPNARLVVDVGIGLEVARDDNGNFSSEEIANAVNKVIGGKSGEEMRLKANELRKKMEIEDKEHMNEAAEQISRICREHKKHK